MRLVVVSLIVALKLLSYLLPSVLSAIGTIVESQRRYPVSRHRRSIAHQVVREAVGVTAETVRRESLNVWAVDGINDQFHVGRFPTDVDRLARLYPQHAAHSATVGLYPTSASARKAATGLARHAFTVDELRRVFCAK